MPSIRAFRALLVASVVASALLTPVAADAASRCAYGHGRVALSGFTGGAHAASRFYAAAESAGAATATIAVTPGDCQGEGGTGSYQTADGTATAPVDYQSRVGTTGYLCADAHPGWCPDGSSASEPVSIPVNDDAEDPPSAVESFEFRLTGGSVGVAEPSSAPVHIVDVDGSSRVSLEPTLEGSDGVAYERSETFPTIRVPVFRAGASGGSAVGYSVEPAPGGGASSDDFSVSSPNPLDIGDQRIGFIDISIVNDRILEDPEALVVTLTDPRAVAPTNTTVTILDNEEPTPPRSRFHHPRNRKKYRWNDYRTREIHIFTSDDGGSTVVGAELALRQKLSNGKCRWWAGRRFRRGPCGQKRWIGDLPTYEPDFFYYRMRSLKPSMGASKIRNYTAFSRAIDGAGNVEAEMRRGQNVSRFEVRSKPSRG